MTFLFRKEINQRIESPFTYRFTAKEEGVYVIGVTATGRGEKQIGLQESDDDDLRVEIDGRPFPHRRNQPRYFDSPAAFSGGQLHGSKKIVFFCIYLSKGDHTVTLIPDRSPQAQEITMWFAGNELTRLDWQQDIEAEDKDRRPWVTFVLVDLPLKKLDVELTVHSRFRDSDDVKLIIDGETKITDRSRWRRFWHWLGAFLKGEKQTHSFDVSRGQETHYIEFWADRKPVLHEVRFDFGKTTKRIPTVYDPLWTGKFEEDTEVMLLARLILGEAEGQSQETKIWVGASVFNRMRSPAWDATLHEVILETGQYDPIKPNNDRHKVIIDPLKDAVPGRKRAWDESYKIAEGLLDGKIVIPTEATHFHGYGVDRDWFIQNVVPQGRFLRQIDDTHFYWSPN